MADPNYESEHDRIERLADEQGFLDQAAIAAMNAMCGHGDPAYANGIAENCFGFARALLNERRKNMIPW